MRRALAVVLAALFASAASATPAVAAKHPKSKHPAPTTTTIWPSLPAISSTLSWSDCGNGFECGRLDVPVDWRAPSGEQLTLALIRHPATSAARIGSLVVNYGGPGASGVDRLPLMWARLPAVVRERFDVVSWDPRGTGRSRPVDCVDDAFLDRAAELDPVPSTDAAWTAERAYQAAFATGCAARSGAYAGQVGTRNTARDLEAIRRALGESHLTYLGYSYGTVVGITYAQMFPASIRALVLDGPPDWWASDVDYGHLQAKGFADALDAFFSWCEQSSSCSLRRAGAPRDAFTQVLERARTNPLPVSYTLAGSPTRAGTLTETQLMTAVDAMLYDTRSWPTLGDALRAAAQDGDGRELLAVADQYNGRSPGGSWSSLTEASAVIFCDDRPDTGQRTDAQQRADVARFEAELPPFGGAFAVAPCTGMPRPSPADELGDVRVDKAPPVLVVATSGDPATPYAGALAFSARIGSATVLTFDSTEHTAYGTARSSCVDDAVDAYLVEYALPPPGTHCAPG